MRLSLWARGSILLLATQPAWAQIVTENAGVVSPEAPILRESLSFFDSEHLRETRFTSQLTFSFDPARELRIAVPLLSREGRFAGPTGSDHFDILGRRATTAAACGPPS